MTTAEPLSAQENDRNVRCCDNTSKPKPNKETKTGSTHHSTTDREQEMGESFILGYN